MTPARLLSALATLAIAGCDTVVDLGQTGGWQGSLICVRDERCEGTFVSGAAACTDASTCDLHASGAAQASCTGEASCSFEVGGGSAISCASSGRCDVQCSGPCWIQCLGPCTCTGAGCSLTCGAEPPRPCSGGGTGCGGGC